MSPTSPEPATVICHYRVKPDREAELLALIRRHEEVVRRLSLVTDEPTRLYRGADEKERPYFVKIFEWQPGAVERAEERVERPVAVAAAEGVVLVLVGVAQAAVEGEILDNLPRDSRKHRLRVGVDRIVALELQRDRRIANVLERRIGRTLV